jgi:hypothetical protein
MESIRREQLLEQEEELRDFFSILEANKKQFRSELR